jgi:histidinol-phosphatase (PHP family)
MAAAAEHAGLRVLGVSEHLYQIREGRGLLADPPLEGVLYSLDDYVRHVRWTAAPGVQVRLGLEVDFVPGRETAIAAFLGTIEDWDFLIGAVHRVEGHSIGEARAMGLAEGWRVWRAYAKLLGAAAESGLYDVLAHPVRLARRISPPPYLGDLLAEVAERASRSGTALELSTPDLVETPAATATLVAACRRAGARVTLGSGAYRPEEVARHFDRAAALLRQHGITSVTGFRGRSPVAEPVPRAPGRRRDG